MKLYKKIFLTILILSCFGFLIICDIADRGQFYSKHIPKDELNEFYINKTPDEQRRAFERNFGFGKYKFPREQTAEIKLFKNTLLTSRIFYNTLDDLNKSDIIAFFNNPNNFDWSETTWKVNESEYILRFYNNENKEIGKIWLCLETCNMTESEPFSPNMKYGGLSETGKNNLKFILNQILNE